MFVIIEQFELWDQAKLQEKENKRILLGFRLHPFR